MIHYRDEDDTWNNAFCSPGWMPANEVPAGEITPHADQVTCLDCLERMAAKTARALQPSSWDQHAETFKELKVAASQLNKPIVVGVQK